MLNALFAVADRYPIVAVIGTLVVIVVVLFFVADIVVGLGEDEEAGVPRAVSREVAAARDSEIRATLTHPRFQCATRGHHDVLVVDSDSGRFFLRCTHCRRETRGITPAAKAGVVTSGN